MMLIIAILTCLVIWLYVKNRRLEKEMKESEEAWEKGQQDVVDAYMTDQLQWEASIEHRDERITELEELNEAKERVIHEQLESLEATGAQNEQLKRTIEDLRARRTEDREEIAGLRLVEQDHLTNCRNKDLLQG